MTGDEEKRSRVFPAAIRQAAFIVLLGSAIGLAFNAMREAGLPLVGSVRMVKFDQPAAVRPGSGSASEPAVADETPDSAAAGTTVTPPAAVEPPAGEAPPAVEVFSPLPAAEPAAAEVDLGPMAIDLSQAREFYEGGMAVFVDARNPDEFAAGHIPGAFNLPYDELESHLDVLNYLPDGGLVVTYCDGSECELSLKLADELSAMGFGQVRVFFGGWEQWIEAGHPTEEGAAFLPQ